MTEQRTTLKLSHAPTAITRDLVPFRIAVYGEGGVGKTTFALSFPKPLVIDTDGGLEGDAVASVDLDGEQWMPQDWKDLNALYFWLKGQIEKKGYQTIVLDSIDTLARFLLHESTDLPSGRSRPKENESTERLITPEQSDYGKVSNAVDIFLGNLKKLSREKGIHIVITSGVRLPDADKGRTKRTFDVQPAVEAIITYWANTYGELTATEKDGQETRVLWTGATNPTRKCKTRYAVLRPGVKDPTYDRLVELVSQKASAK